MRVFAHRGFSGLYPENTMLAFEKASELPVDGIEMDVHLSSDGKVVIIHDESLERTTGVQKNVWDCSFRELTSMTASRTMENMYDAKIPSFEEFCDLIWRTGLTANVEIKTGKYWYPSIEEKTWDIIRAFNIEDRIIFSSFNWLSVVKCRQIAPDVPCGLLFGRMTNIRNLAYQASEFGIQFLHPDFRGLSAEIFSESRAAGVGINVWTPNEKEEIIPLVGMGVDGLISNFPNRCLEILGR